MDAIQLLTLSVLLLGVGAIASLILAERGFSAERGLYAGRSNQAARYASGIVGMLGCGLGLAAAIFAAGKSPVASIPLLPNMPFGNFTLQIDGLSAFLLGLISIIGFAASLYSISYLKIYENRSLGGMVLFTNLFIAMMMLVVTVANAFYFLVFWEMMTVASYFLVIFESEKKAAVQAGYLYMLIAHAGGALIMLAFFVFYLQAGSFDFAAFRQAQLSPGLRNLVFILAFIGFGAKAGMVPLHIWMPATYSAAPSHVTALMSSVMKKTAIYGILRICVDLLGVSVLWWGLVVLFFGAISAVFGVLYALVEHDLKRMLAYSSVENVGIILMGIGVGMLGLATQQPNLALLGFLAALYHTLNHSFFKGLLFLGAGSVIAQADSANLNQMGGLARRMPWTALAFLIGALAVAAIPPLNGFVSEWFTYQSLFTASSSPSIVVRIVAPLCAVLLSFAGALAAMVFIKAYGSAFTGPAHSPAVAQAQEAGSAMVAGMAILALGCILLGVGAPWIAPYLVQAAASIPHVSALPVASAVWVFPVQESQGLVAMPLAAILLVSFLAAPVLLIAIYGGYKAGRRIVKDPWNCGYGYSAQMSITASSFDQPMRTTFGALYSLRNLGQKPFEALASWSRRAKEVITQAEPVLERVVTQPTARVVEYLGTHIQALQMGDIRVYCLYIILSLAVLLIVIFGF